jgi:SAM-dependent methyltransferase
MSYAQNYYRWVMQVFRPFIAGTVLELGAGIGNFSAHLIAAGPERVVLVEPAEDLFERLRTRFAGSANVETFHGELGAWAGQQAGRRVDVVVSVNVLEHIQDDRGVMRLVSAVVRPGGLVLLLVPALPALYGSLDASFGHLRRYNKGSLGALLDGAGLVVRRMRYMNMAGAIAWFAAGRVLRRRALSPLLVRVADAVMIPAGMLFEPLVNAPFGQSLIAIAEKPSTDC